jgi:putative sterol carrier protein
MMPDAETLLEEMRAKASGSLRRLGYRLRFDLTDEAVSLLVDGTGDGPAVIGMAEPDAEADTVLRLSSGDLAKFIAGRLNPMVAYATGRLKIEGSTGVALKLASLLDGD